VGLTVVSEMPSAGAVTPPISTIHQQVHFGWRELVETGNRSAA
jgi:hypothetical protein